MDLAFVITGPTGPPPIPTLTEWGMIIFGLVLVGFITWVFLRRRKAAVSLP
jgi:LPXTG-motif cell wall-anchored protein